MENARLYPVPLNARMTRAQDAKLKALESATRRNRSELIRLLIDAAVSDGEPDVWLDSAQLEGGKRYGTER